MSAKKQLLDPIGSLCKLLSLIFHDDNTKISVQDHVLYLQEPSGYQWMVRYCNGDGRENISELYYVLIRLIKWYLMPEYNNIEEYIAVKTENIDNNLEKNQQDQDHGDQNIFMAGGFSDGSGSERSSGSSNTNSIKTTHSNKSIRSENKYSEDMTTSSIENYFALVNSDEIRKMVEYLCDAFEKLQERTYEYGNVVLALQYYIILLKSALNGTFSDSMLPKYILEKDKEYGNLLDYNKLKNLWSISKMKRICALYDNCFNVQKDSTMNNVTKQNLIKSYLKSVDSILEESDQEFQKLIINSNRG